VAERIAAAGGRAEADETAVGSWSAARAIVAHAMDTFGRIDLLVNSAGIGIMGSLAALDEELADRILEINLHGTFALTRAVWPIMAERRRGSILSMSSNAALGYGFNSAYAISKAGIIGLTLDAAREGAALGIRVNALMPLAYTKMAEQIDDRQYLAWVRDNLPVETISDVGLRLLSDVGASGQIVSCGGGSAARVSFAKDALAEVEKWNPSQASDHGLSGWTKLDSGADELKAYFHRFPPPFAITEQTMRGDDSRFASADG
jgi:short-subunit dehydrogenase involved in D-alanine esterification of teichoic acids